MSNIIPFVSKKLQSQKLRFERFIQWGLPHGTGGMNEFSKHPEYDKDSFFITLTPRFFQKEDKTLRVRAIKFEFNDREVVTRITNQVIDPKGLIEEPFRSFFKAWLNVMIVYKQKKGFPKVEPKALKALEYALRLLHNDNSPWLIDDESVLLAERILQESSSESIAYEACMHLEMLVGMLQTGYKGRVYSFKGFDLLTTPVDFKCCLKDRVKKTALEITNEKILNKKTDERLTYVEIATVGLAYRKAKNLHGNKSYLTYYAALSVVAAVISVRPSEVLNLTTQSLIFDDENQRYKIYIYRSKIGAHQLIPVPRKLSDAIKEVFETLVESTREARKVVTFYFEGWKQVQDIDRLYNEDVFEKGVIDEYISCDFIYKLFFQHISFENFLCVHLKGIMGLDLYKALIFDKKICIVKKRLSAKNFYNVEEVSFFCNSNGIPNTLKEVDCEFCSKNILEPYITKGCTWQKNNIFSNLKSYSTNTYVHFDAFKSALLRESKKSLKEIKCWPFADKDQMVPLISSLGIGFIKENSESYQTINHGVRLITSNDLVRMYSSVHGKKEGGQLYQALDIKYSDGSFPSISIYSLRKNHQTQALLNGISVVAADKLAGRSTGYQSEYYDLRTPEEVVSQSIEFLEFSSELNVVGDVVKHAPKDPVKRKYFLYQNAMVKLTTDVGGCTADIALDPCELHGNCFLCSKQNWMKGDKVRLQNIKDQRALSASVIRTCKRKISEGNGAGSIKKHLQRAEAELQRCDEILMIEKDRSIKTGTLVTFSAPRFIDTEDDRVHKIRAYNEDIICCSS